MLAFFRRIFNSQDEKDDHSGSCLASDVGCSAVLSPPDPPLYEPYDRDKSTQLSCSAVLVGCTLVAYWRAKGIPEPKNLENRITSCLDSWLRPQGFGAHVHFRNTCVGQDITLYGHAAKVDNSEEWLYTVVVLFRGPLHWSDLQRKLTKTRNGISMVTGNMLPEPPGMWFETGPQHGEDEKDWIRRCLRYREHESQRVVIGDRDSFILGLKLRTWSKPLFKDQKPYCWLERDIAEVMQVPYELVYDLQNCEYTRIDPWKGRDVINDHE